MNVSEAVALGAVQGLTEFLPVSSSAHLVLLREVFGRRPQQDGAPLFDVALHLATAAALLAAVHRDLLPPPRSLLVDVFRHRLGVRCYRAESRLALRIAAGNLPAVVVGGVLHRRIAAEGRSPARVAAMLALGAAGMAAVERLPAGDGTRGTAEITTGQALAIGVAQTAALLPGVSRAGATVAAGAAAGLDRRTAARFSFLLAAPITVAAAVRTLPEARSMLRTAGAAPLAAGAAAAFVTGLLGIALLRRVVERGGLMSFVWYRLALAGAIWAWQAAAGSRR